MGGSRGEAEGTYTHTNHPNKFVLLVFYRDEKLKSYKGMNR